MSWYFCLRIKLPIQLQAVIIGLFSPVDNVGAQGRIPKSMYRKLTLRLRYKTDLDQIGDPPILSPVVSLFVKITCVETPRWSVSAFSYLWPLYFGDMYSAFRIE